MLNISQIAHMAGIPPTALHYRLAKGWSLEKSLLEPDPVPKLKKALEKSPPRCYKCRQYKEPHQLSTVRTAKGTRCLDCMAKVLATNHFASCKHCGHRNSIKQMFCKSCKIITESGKNK